MKLLFKIFFILTAFQAFNAYSQTNPVEEYNVTNSLQGKNFRDYKLYDQTHIEDAKLKAIQLSDPEIMYNLGCMYRDGVGFKLDYRQAKEWFTKATTLNHYESMVELAKILSYDKKRTGVAQDLDKAEELLNKAIASKKPSVYYKVGLMYEKGVFFDKNANQAIRLYKLAAKGKYDKAYVKLYSVYEYGQGVKASKNMSLKWLRVIQKMHSEKNVRDYATYMLSEKYFDLAKHLPQSKDSEKFQLYNASWDNGKAEAADMIAESYARGFGTKRNCDTAKKWYEMSIRQFESVQAMERLATMLMDADCGNYKRDYKTAGELFEKAATQGGFYGAYMVGYMLQNGIGKEKSPYEANTWFSRSEKLKQHPLPVLNKRRKFVKEEQIK